MVFKAALGTLHTAFRGENSVWKKHCTCQLEESGGILAHR